MTPDEVIGLGQVLTAFAAIPILPFDAAAATVFEDLVAGCFRIGRMALRIASTTLFRDIVVTRRARDIGQVRGLPIEDGTI